MKRIAIAFLSSVLALHGLAHGQEAQKREVTTVADNRYGEGGHRTTYSEGKQVTKEIWSDKKGRVLEQHVYGEKGEEEWTFQDGPVFRKVRLRNSGGGWKLSGESNRTPSDSEIMTRDEALKMVKLIEEQFVAQGKIPDGFPTRAYLAKLAPNECFNLTRVEPPHIAGWQMALLHQRKKHLQCSANTALNFRAVAIGVFVSGERPRKYLSRSHRGS